MDYSLKKMLGLLSEGKREYRFLSGEVTREEFEYCQTIDQLLFGEGGYIETLGPTWDMIHDPRFVKIENAFIVNRKAVFGGDAMLGKQYISSDGQFTSTIADLEQYSETLGEGRYFHTVLIHPDKDCPKRLWLLRIFPEMMKKQGYVAPEASENLVCGCKGASIEPKSIHTAPDEYLWDLIKQECPNYFTQDGKPNGMAKRLFDLFREDLLGLIDSYAQMPLSDVYIELDTGDILAEQAFMEEKGFIPHVFLEVDILEKALTQRAILRATAAKILRQIGFQQVIKEELGGDVRLTDSERDEVLRLVYNPPKIGGLEFNPDTNWFGFLHAIKGQVTQYVKRIKATGLKFKEREKEQLARATDRAQKVFNDLETGELKPINQFTEPEVETVLDAHAEVMQSILKNPLKQELFIMWVAAEERSSANYEGNDGLVDTDRMNMHQLYSILTPIFTDHGFDIGEEQYNEYMQKAIDLGYFKDNKTTTVEEVLGPAASELD